MGVNDRLRQLVDGCGQTKSALCRKLGMAPQTMNTRLRSDVDPKAGFVAALLDLMDYDLVAVPKGAQLPRGSVVFDPDFVAQSYPNRANGALARMKDSGKDE